ncbi:hypothetical protein phytr_990 [Candidatus Phycorickettsia trachydisci]|uniref:Core domain-containing protein n=1 Tax=Candidatus Phycorickettsia trachydisci TaxID=2115978 RepID=A0A2P1P712_9RICK|nr:iron-sulfur cluster assembly accessory protein [Candidatus Phycorickettsia trachydisci]AVP87060.1 hypothetical protein phytr_990 [Candidatus Phycorickettsia trachydisci]
MVDFNIQVTSSAIKRVKTLLAKRGDAKLRISVESGGCSGMQYKYEFVQEIEEGDQVIKKEGIVILIDPISREFLEGSIVDYVQNLGSAYFEIRNPQASAKCGCGNSFAV